MYLESISASPLFAFMVLFLLDFFNGGSPTFGCLNRVRLRRGNCRKTSISDSRFASKTVIKQSPVQEHWFSRSSERGSVSDDGQSACKVDFFVIPAKAGIQPNQFTPLLWIPASAGMTDRRERAGTDSGFRRNDRPEGEGRNTDKKIKLFDGLDFIKTAIPASSAKRVFPRSSPRFR